MSQSKNVSLRRVNVEGVNRMLEIYGSDEGLIDALNSIILSLRALRPPVAVDTNELLQLLSCIEQYGALGDMGGPSAVTARLLLDRLQLLLKLVFNGALRADATAAEVEFTVEVPCEEAVVALISRCISNCRGGVMVRSADTEFRVDWQDGHWLSVVLGFSDWAETETGARLWAGAVGLSLFVLENFHDMMRAGAASAGMNVIELGCGPGLVSLVFARRFLGWRKQQSLSGDAGRQDTEPHPPRVRLDITDVSETVVAEVERSFSNRNGSDMRPPSLAAVGLKVNPCVLDFGAPPPEMRAQYDIVLGSDIVYDFHISSLVAPALQFLLRPGGTAYLCCERHRDGMGSFVNDIQRFRRGELEVVRCVDDVQSCLVELEMMPGLTTSSCALIEIKKC